jgi:predicted O-methyltransferase YrrM
MISLNKKEYQNTNIFEHVHNEEYFNLKIYPLVGILEKEAGLLSDIAEGYLLEEIKCNCIIYTSLENTSLKNTSLQNTSLQNEKIQFFEDNLLNFETILITNDQYISKNKNILWIDDSFTNYEIIEGDIVFSKENEYLNRFFKYKVNFDDNKVLYLNDKDFFMKYFYYYFDSNGVFKYDNLICYTMIIKNGGPLLEQVLNENLSIIDRWCILDTGSTDGTQEVIRRVLKNKKGILYEEPFVNFKVSRNRCLELAGKTCKFTLMLDDTYGMRVDIRSFLNEVRGDQFSDSFSLMIQSSDNEYYSNRIIKTKTELRYIHIIHEVITDKNNITVAIPVDRAFIFDHRSDYMEKRTNDRKKFDLELLFKEVEEFPDDPRALYYIAQTYGCIGDEINRAKYYELRINHPVEGYVQEKIDSLFELARIYNFKLNCETKKFIDVNYKLSNSQWKRCEELYIQAYNLDKKRPDSLYFIGIHYYLEKEYTLAYNYLKLGFEIGYPMGSQYSLKPTLSFHFLPKFLTEVCYFMNDYQTGFAAAELFLKSTIYNKPNGESWNLMLNWYNIHKNLLNMGSINNNPKNNNKIFCIVTDGGWENWNGADILTKGLGGSETWIIETARNIKNYNVIVFCKTDKPELFENVGYNPIELFPNFIANNVVDYCIISRFPEYIPVALKGHTKNVGIIFHDLLAPEIIIQAHEKLKWIFGLTDWHKNHIKNIFPIFKDIIYKSNYGINEIFKPSIKIKNSFIYSSFPNRGLVVLLRMWTQIIKIIPDAILNIYCNLEQEWVNKVAPDIMKEIKTLLKVNKKGITLHGWVNKETLAKAWSLADYWLYPCTFEETFCLTALEAAITKTCIISNNLAGLSETIGDRGIIIHGDPYSEEWQEECLQKIKNINDSLKNELIEKNYNWAIQKTWKNETHQFLKTIGIFDFKKYWHKDININNKLIEKTKGLKSIIDIGCGPYPFKNANITLDLNHPATHKIDITIQELPDEKYDFIYSRHLIEDLKDPSLILSQIKKKGISGYIETPSVFAECCRGIDYTDDYTKIGYHHHHSILWVENNTLMILPKIEEFLQDFDQNLIRKQLEDPIAWNIYLFFENSNFNYVILEKPSSKEEYISIIIYAFKYTCLNIELIKHGFNHGNILNWTHDMPKETRKSFEKSLLMIPEKSKILEIGTYAGLSIIEMLKLVPESTAIVIDLWENYYEYDNGVGLNILINDSTGVEKLFYKNIKPFESRIQVLKGKSSDKLFELLLKNELFNFIYVDGSHRCLDVYLNIMIAWKLLKIGGIIVFDDYCYNKRDILNSPYEAIEKFKNNYLNDFLILHQDYRVFLKKIN